MVQTLTLPLQASDLTGQRLVKVADAPTDATIGELVDGLLPRMNLPRNDNGGKPLTYHARLDREGRHLHASELVGETLQPNDRLVLHPEIHAGQG
jgi:hypothetical protein